jgi:hypothetical protein
MSYVAWALFCEGGSDRAYLEVLLPRIMEEVLRRDGKRPATIPESPAVKLGKKGREIDAVAGEICADRDCFHLAFIHADTGGRGVARSLDRRGDAYCQKAAALCGFDCACCVILAPCRELEAWALADPAALAEALGYRGDVIALGAPADAVAAEKLPDPKEALNQVAQGVRRRRRNDDYTGLLTAVAQIQSIDELRRSESFQAFEAALRCGLSKLGLL